MAVARLCVPLAKKGSRKWEKVGNRMDINASDVRGFDGECVHVFCVNAEIEIVYAM